MTLKTIYDVTVSLLTPLHIGNGQELHRDYDYVTRNGRTWMMNADAFLEAIYWRDGNFDERIIGRPASELLEPSDFQEESEYFRYVLQGQPRSEGHAAVIQEQIKDVRSCPYLPGSSLKGALRTVLAWHGFQEKGLSLDAQKLRGSRSWAGQGYERAIFGRNPNHDLLRALQVADSEPQTQERLQIVNAQVFTGGNSPGAPIELEAVRSDTVFKTTIIVDEYLHSEQAERVLNHAERWNWLRDLPQIAQRYGLVQIQQEQQWYQRRNYPQVAGFYAQMHDALRRNVLAENSFLLQIGWGGGWGSKTIGQPLKQDQRAWERLLGDKRLSPARMRRRSGDEFPKSRRAVSINETPAAPLGWSIVEMEERE